MIGVTTIEVLYLIFLVFFTGFSYGVYLITKNNAHSNIPYIGLFGAIFGTVGLLGFVSAKFIAILRLLF